MKTTIRFEGVSKRYRLGLTRTSVPALIRNKLKNSLQGGDSQSAAAQTFWALQDVSFALQPGESLALVGANGAGKTTILKLLARITKPTAGTIQRNGTLSALIELGAGFHPDLTGRENVFLNGTILGIDRRTLSRRFDEIVAFSELDHFIDTPVKRYSSGMVIRLGFAVASCIEPEILLVDEVLAVGDAAFQQKCLKRIRTLIDNGTSIVFVSHNFYLVQAVCNQALYLQRGQVKELGATKEVIARYEQDLHRERAAKFAAAAQASAVGINVVNTGLISSDDVELTRVEVVNNTNYPAESLSSREPARIRLHYNAYKALGKVQASVFIMRSDGLTCAMMRTKLDDFELVVAQGAGVITVDLTPLQLISGTYYAEAWMLNATDSMTLHSSAGRSDWFTVQGAALSYEESSGVFEPQTRWAHSTSEGATPINGSAQATNGRVGKRSIGSATEQEFAVAEKVSATW